MHNYPNLLLIPLLCLLVWTPLKSQNISVAADNLNVPLGVVAEGEGFVRFVQTGTGNDDAKVSVLAPDDTVFDVIIDLPSYLKDGEEVVGVWHTFVLNDEDRFRMAVVSGEGDPDNPAAAAIIIFDLTDVLFEDLPLTLADAETIIPLGAKVNALGFPLSNPYSLTQNESGDLFFIDAGANSLFQILDDGEISLIVTFPDFPNPTPVGPPMINPVPTKVFADGDDGFVVTLFSGFPFLEGTSSIVYVTADGVIADTEGDFTLIADVDIDPSDGNLALLQFASFELGPVGYLPNSAKVIKLYPDGRREVIASDFGPSSGFSFDEFGNIYASSLFTGELLKIEYPRPANDELCDATPLTVGESCNGTPNGDFTNATPEVDEFIPSCFSTFLSPFPKSVWYSFTAPESGLVLISTNYPDVGTAEDVQMALYSLNGENCVLDSLEQVACNNGEILTAGTESLATIAATLTPGETYYIQVAEEDPELIGSFCIQIEAFEPPSNDDVCNAVALELDADATEFSNIGATPSPEELPLAPAPDPTDFFGLTSWGFNVDIQHSVWFSFVAPESGAVDLDLSDNSVLGNFNSKIAIYEANDCSGISAENLIASQLNYFENNSVGNPFGTFSLLSQNRLHELACLTPGQTYYILVDGHHELFGLETNNQGRGLISVKTISPEPLGSTATIFSSGCESDNEGAILANGTGGIGGSRSIGRELRYTYEWSNGETTPVIRDLAPGTYSLTVTDGCGSTATQSYTVVADETPSINNLQDIVTEPNTDNTLLAFVTGGNPFDTQRAYRTAGPPFGPPSANLYTFELQSNAESILIGGDSIPNIPSLTYSPETLYGMARPNFEDNTNELYQINATTGEFSQISTLFLSETESFIDIEYNLFSGALLGISNDSRLYQIDATSGNTTLLSELSIENISNFVVKNGNTIVVEESDFDKPTTSYHEIDLTTNNTSLIGEVDFFPNSSNRVAIDPYTNDLYIRSRDPLTNVDVFYLFHLITGDLTALNLQPANFENGILGFTIAPRTEEHYMYAWTPTDGLDAPSSFRTTVNVDENTTYTLTATDACGESSTKDVDIIVGGTADLAVSISSALTEYTIYEVVPYTITVSNSGSSAATNITVAAGLPEGMVHTSNNALQGSYNLFFEEWTIPFLAGGETATLELVLFPLVRGTDLTNFVQVTSADQDDPDSTPGNDTDNTVDEDDEASLTLSSSNLQAPDHQLNLLRVGAQLSPNPATDQIQLSFVSPQEAATHISIYDAMGKLVIQKEMTVFTGFNQTDFNIKNLASGNYFVVIYGNENVLKFSKL